MSYKIGIILAGFFFSFRLHAESKCGDDHEFNPFRNHKIEYRNLIVDKVIKKGKTFAARTNLGQLRDRPKPLTPNDELFQQAQDLYEKKDHQGAIKILLAVFKLDKQNPFVREAIARNYYKSEGQKGRAIIHYIELMKIIEKGYFESEEFSVTITTSKEVSESVVIIDPWFLDAYWKLGTLYLDVEEYQKAIIEISKLYYFGFKPDLVNNASDRAMAAHIFGYLAEAYFHTKQKKANNYFFCRTKEIDPQNTYVDQFELK